MSDFIDGKALRKLQYGKKVTATARAHANASTDTFNVYGGRVIITLIYGVVTVAPGGACNISIGNNPTLAGATSVDYCAAADCNGAAIGDQICIEYTAGQLTTHAGAGVTSAKYSLIAQTGTIYVKGTAAQGTSQWTLFYVPIDDGAYITTV